MYIVNLPEQVGKLNDPRGQASHFRPLTPGLQVHRPVSISHIKLAEPNLLHLQAAKYRKNQNSMKRQLQLEINVAGISLL